MWLWRLRCGKLCVCLGGSTISHCWSLALNEDKKKEVTIESRIYMIRKHLIPCYHLTIISPYRKISGVMHIDRETKTYISP